MKNKLFIIMALLIGVVLGKSIDNFAFQETVQSTAYKKEIVNESSGKIVETQNSPIISEIKSDLLTDKDEQQKQAENIDTSGDVFNSEVNVYQNKISELTQEISRLNTLIDSLQGQNNPRLNPLEQLKNGSNKDTNTATKYTKEQLATMISEPFLSVVVDLNDSFAAVFDDFAEEDSNYDWAYEMENRLKDFIVMHERANDIRLESVICKTTICEIKGFQYNHLAWNHVTMDLTKQEWWQFSSTHSQSQSSQEYGDYFYVLLRRLTTH